MRSANRPETTDSRHRLARGGERGAEAVIDRATGIRAGRLALAVVGLYLVLVGGTELATLYAEIRAINGLLSIGVIAVAITRRWPRPDVLAVATALAAIGFTFAALVSPLPRYTFDVALAGLSYAAGFLLLRRALAHPATYVWARQLLAVVALAFIATFTVIWLGLWASWLTATEFTLLPPLTLPLQTIFFRHVHVVAFTAALLLPAVWALPGMLIGNMVRAAATLATLFLVLASGSRTVLLAALLATIAVYGYRWRSRLRVSRRAAIGLGAVAAAVIAGVVLAGAADSLTQRLLTITTIAARGEIWGSTVSGWLERPLFGYGPGTFLLAFPWTGYYDTNVFSPRHADNAFLQLLFELGLVGAALVLPMVVLVLRRALVVVPRPEARWSILFVAFGTITDNPTDTVGLVVLVIFWGAAIASPTAIEAAMPLAATRQLLRAGALLALGVVAVAWISLTVADFSYSGARRAAATRSETNAERQLTLAATLDPTNALYRRQLGVLHASRGEVTTAVRHLEVALALNGADDVTRRGLGLLYLDMGRDDNADRLTASAVSLRGTEPVNHLARVHVQLAQGDEAGAAESAARAVALRHWVVAADGWERFLDPLSTDEVADLAAARMRQENPPRSSLPEIAWVLGMVGRGEEGAAVGAEGGDPTAEAIGLMFDCRPDEATAVLEAAARTHGSDSGYWLMRYLAVLLAGEDTAMTERVLTVFLPTIATSLHGTDRPRASSPLVDELRDTYLYDRLPMRYDMGGVRFPNAAAGPLSWLRDPDSTAVAVAPRSGLAECAGD